MVQPRRGLRSPKHSPKDTSNNDSLEPLKRKSPKNRKVRKEHLSDDEECSSDNSEGYDEPDRHASIGSSCFSDLSPRSNNSFGSSTDSFATAHYSSRLEDEPKEGRGKYSNVTKRKELKQSHTKEVRREFSCEDFSNEEIKDQQIKNKKLRGEVRMIVRRIMGLTAACLFLLAIFYMLSTRNSRHQMLFVKEERTLKDIHSDMKSGLHMLHNKFNQPRHLWVQLMSSINSLMVADPISPAVLLTLVPLDSQQTSVCLLQRIAQITTDAFGDSRSVLVDVSSSDSTDSLALKRDIHTSLNGLSDTHVAVIHNLEKIPGDAAMIFHSYCDNENAPHKRALFIMSLEINMSYNNLTNNNLDDTVDRYLSDLWDGAIRDVDVAAIKTRIANSPIIVKPEPQEHILSVCPL